MTGFELQISGIGRDRFSICAITPARLLEALPCSFSDYTICMYEITADCVLRRWSFDL